MRLLLIIFISAGWSVGSLRAMDFAPSDDDDDFSEQSTAVETPSANAELNMDSDSDSEQSHTRVTRDVAFGLSLGEAVPHAASGVVWQMRLNEQSNLSAGLARGDYRAAEQSEGEAWFENRAKTWIASGRYLWWPNSEFPFGFSAGGSVETASGKVSSKTGAHGSYRTETAYVSSSLLMSHLFPSGFWLEWTLISFHYGKNLKGSYDSTTGSQMQRIRKNLNGLKILGFANITLGYAW